MPDRKFTLTERRIVKGLQVGVQACFGVLRDQASRLSDAELEHAMAWARDLGQSNCGWQDFAMRPTLMAVLSDEKHNRRARHLLDDMPKGPSEVRP